MPDAHPFGAYQLLHLIATGGMGEVFLATRGGPGGFSRLLVVKRLLRHLERDPAFVEMFLNEARIAARLSHPNVVQIIELGKAEGRHFIAMEHIHGRSLKEVLKALQAAGRTMSAPLSAFIVAEALRGLDYAHHLRDAGGASLGVIHRDISPDNLMIGFAGEVKLLDFGIAKAMDAQATTRPGTVKGKYAYMAPEQAQCQPLDHRSDVYSVGVMLYELLAGARPFEGDTDAAVLAQLLAGTPKALSSRNPSAPPVLAAAAMRALSMKPADRFASAAEMIEALDGFRRASPIHAQDLATLMESLFGADAKADPLKAFGNDLTRGVGPGGTVSLRPTASSAPTVAASGPSLAIRGQRWAVPLFGVIAVAAGLWVAVVAPSRATTNAGSRQVPAGPPESTSPPGAVGSLQQPPSTADATQSTRDVASPHVPRPVAEPVRVKRDASVSIPIPSQTPSSSSSSRRSAARPGAMQGKQLSTGRLDIRVKPWAEVFYRGKSLGTTPFDPIELPSGEAVLLLRNDSLSIERSLTVTVKAGQLVTVRENLLSRP